MTVHNLHYDVLFLMFQEEIKFTMERKYELCTYIYITEEVYKLNLVITFTN